MVNLEERDGGVGIHRGPALGAMALVHVALFLASVATLVIGGHGRVPMPYESAEAARPYFEQNSSAVRWAGFLQFGAAIPLGIYTATMTSRLRFLGLNVAGVSIASFGGCTAAVMLALCGLLGWVLSQPGIASEAGMVRALQLMAFATGGVGTAVPFGLLVAGISVSAGITRLLPRWIAVWGLVVALLAEVATISLLAPQASVLLPLARFLGMAWITAAGLALPARRTE